MKKESNPPPPKGVKKPPAPPAPPPIDGCKNIVIGIKPNSVSFTEGFGKIIVRADPDKNKT